MNCIACSKELEGRADKKYCDEICKKRYLRGTNVPTTELSGTDDCERFFCKEHPDRLKHLCECNPSVDLVFNKGCEVASPNENTTQEERDTFINILSNYA